jgi:hypothetical protein
MTSRDGRTGEAGGGAYQRKTAATPAQWHSGEREVGPAGLRAPPRRDGSLGPVHRRGKTVRWPGNDKPQW